MLRLLDLITKLNWEASKPSLLVLSSERRTDDFYSIDKRAFSAMTDKTLDRLETEQAPARSALRRTGRGD